MEILFKYLKPIPPQEEDGVHLFRCSHESNRLFQKRALDTLLHNMSGRTDPVALQILRRGISSITNGTDIGMVSRPGQAVTKWFTEITVVFP